MTDISQKKETLKKMVRSLLISSPVELPVGQLLKDYHSFLGEPLDYRSLGYATAEEFFRDISDTVTIGWKQGMMTLRAVADETTKHIENMVSKQKKPSKKKTLSYFRGREPPRRYGYGSDSRPPRFNRDRNLPQPKMVPAYVRNQMIQLIKSFPDGIPLKDLDTAFVRHFGSRINISHYGFYSLEEFFDALKDVIRLKEICTGEMLILPAKYNNEYHSHYTQRNVVKEERNIVNNVIESKEERIIPDQEPSRVRRPPKGRGRRKENSGTGNTQVGMYAQSEGSSGSNSSGNSKNKQDNLELEIQQVLEDKPDGVWASKFPEEFMAKHGRPLDFVHHGFLSVIEFVSSASSVVQIERPIPNGDWKLFDARIQRPKNVKSEDLRNSRTQNNMTEDETKQAIQRLLKRQTKGIPMKEFPAYFKDNTGKDIPVADFGYNTPEDYFLSLADWILQIHYTKEGVLMMYPINAEIPADIDPENEKSSQHDYPVDVVGPGCHFTPVGCPTIDEYTGLYVSNIINPGLFWVILRHKQSSLALETLMTQIDEFYSSLDSKDYTLPESLVVPGQVCALLFPEDNNWHRGVITKINEEGFVGVYFVDYGNTAYVPKKAIKFLRSEFLKLPAQAIQARLANIVPSTETGSWKVKSRNRMLELVKERPLVAFVTNVKLQVLSLCLTDTSDPDIDLHINDILVTEGFAQFKADEEVPDHVTKDQHKEVPDYCHVFGYNIVEPPRLPEAAGVNLQQNKDRSSNQRETSNRCYVRWLQLTKDRTIHLINLDGVAYIVSAELSSFFWEEDVLGSMLKRMNIEAKKRSVSSDEYPRLFQELTNYNVKSFTTEKLGTQRFIFLYEFNSVPTILRTFLEDEPELIEAVEELVSQFDPDSSYWKSGQRQEETVTEGEEGNGEIEETVNLSLDETQIVLQALLFRRKRILQTLMSSSVCSTDMVNKLNNCETEIVLLKKQISDQQQTGSVPSPPNSRESQDTVTMGTSTDSTNNTVSGTQIPDGTDKSAENQRVIQNIINSATKPIATANIVKAMTSISVSETCSTSVSTSTPYLQNQIVTQSQTGSNPGLMGMTDSQKQEYFNSMMMLQPGMMPFPGMANVSNYAYMMGASMGQGLVPGYQQMFAPQMNPLVSGQFQLPGHPSMVMQHAPEGGLGSSGSAPTLGRGQPLGILPGLLPLFQNLSLGRGRGGQ